MNTSNLELCKELYELSGWWDDGELFWHWGLDDELWHQDEEGTGFTCPGYELGFLLRKLPAITDNFTLRLNDSWWVAKVEGHTDKLSARGGTPEDAVCKLAIELFKQGVLKK